MPRYKITDRLFWFDTEIEVTGEGRNGLDAAEEYVRTHITPGISHVNGERAKSVELHLDEDHSLHFDRWYIAAFIDYNEITELIGYDGKPYTIGDRVELHPAHDLWMRGARFGEVVGVRSTPKDRVHVKLDKRPGHVFGGAEDQFRKV